jgi:hypothetical protein
MTRRRREEELDRDIREHLEMEIQDNLERGMTPEAARAAALRKFGNVARIKEDTRAPCGAGCACGAGTQDIRVCASHAAEESRFRDCRQSSHWPLALA